MSLSTSSIARRTHWVERLSDATGTGDFSTKADVVWQELKGEFEQEGPAAVLEHLQLCGTIPERYGHDSSEEKLYSKYTDMLLALAFDAMGMRASVIAERADSADVDIVCDGYGFVADAKAFRLSRTAKNQKDFKVESMAQWRGDRDHSLLICPIFQYPTTNSQIYRQAIERQVCLLSYMHLRVLVRAFTEGRIYSSEEALLGLFRATENAAPDKSAANYWSLTNSALLTLGDIESLWDEEGALEHDALEVSKAEALGYLKDYENELRGLEHEELLERLIDTTKLRQKATVISRQAGTEILRLS